MDILDKLFYYAVISLTSNILLLGCYFLPFSIIHDLYRFQVLIEKIQNFLDIFR